MSLLLYDVLTLYGSTCILKCPRNVFLPAVVPFEQSTGTCFIQKIYAPSSSLLQSGSRKEKYLGSVTI